MFVCDCCGLCCKNLRLSSLYDDLDRGDGVCIYFDESSNLCKIYDERPVKCNIDMTYELFLKDKMSIEEYYKQNYLACEMLRRNSKCI